MAQWWNLPDCSMSSARIVIIYPHCDKDVKEFVNTIGIKKGSKAMRQNSQRLIYIVLTIKCSINIAY